MLYLEPQVARERLIRYGLYSEESAPSVEAIAEILLRLQIRVDEWLDYSLSPTQYTERLTSNVRGFLLVHNYPVIEIVKVSQVLPQTSPRALTFINPQALWDGKRTLAVGDTGGINYDVTYVAGYNPVPAIFSDTMFSLLSKTLQSGGLDFLDEPVRDLVNVSLPGGLSQTYRLGSESKGGSGGSGSTGLDRALAPLAKYRWKIRT